jgi:predicted restriction endonuclease
MWQEMQADWDSFAVIAQEAMDSLGIKLEAESALVDGGSEEAISNYEGSNVIALVAVRVRQAFFRRSILSAYSNRCCVTGLSIPRLLVASHIVPWSVDAKNRLNPSNGLCLSVLHDKAFDAGLLTVNDDMTIQISKKGLRRKDDFFASSIMAYEGKAIAVSKKFRPDKEFLKYHRNHIFEASAASPKH